MLADINDIEQLENCQTTGELEAAATSLAEALGFEYWAYGLDLPVFDDHRRQFLVGGYPDEWLEHYFAHDYLRADPVIAHCQIHTTPFAWPPPDSSMHRKGTRRSLS